MTELPSGTVTMLFSDIEGSTALLHRLGDEWGAALTAHRSILRRAFADHSGVEMGTEGDSFFVVFASARAALLAALAAQRGMHAHSWPGDRPVCVRIGLHTGEPQRHDDGYIGADVHRAARIGATAHGGQVVVSSATQALAGRVPGAVFRDLGRHRLKDLPEPEHLFDVVADDLPSDFPPPRSLGRISSLPVFATGLVGRDADIAAVDELLRSSRLVTLTGPGGAGKTRLATAVAAAAADRYPDGVWFVGLSSAADLTAMWTQLGEVIDADVHAAADPADAVHAAVDTWRALLVLDNLEHLPDVDEPIAALLSAAPHVDVLATSRRALLLAGQHEFPVEPLAVPHDATDAEGSPAVELFAQRARAVRPGFAVDAANAADVAELCRRLDGLPLAIELAAAHLRLLSPTALLARLDTRLGRGVTAGDRPERQRSLGAAIAWSYDLLPEADRAVFRRLGVFRAPADLDAVAAVTGLVGDAVYEVASRLVETSLVRVVPGADGEPRLTLLQTIRGFALERLATTENGADEPATRLRHLRWCVTAAGRAVQRLRGPLHTRALDELAGMEDDIRAALDFALRPAVDDADRERITLGNQLLVDVSTRYWYSFGSVAEARAWQERGLQLAREDEPAAMFWLLHGLGKSLLQDGEIEAAASRFDRALHLARRIADGALESRALNDLAIVRRAAGSATAARDLLEQAFAAAQAAGHVTYQARSLGNLAVVLVDAGDYTGAADALRRAMEVNAAAGNNFDLAVDRLNYTATVLRAEGPVAALVRYREWAHSILDFRENQLSVDVVEVGAAIAAGLGAAVTAARLLGAADALRALHRMPRSPQEKELTTAWLAAARAALPEQQWDEAYRAGEALAPAAAAAEVAALHAPVDQGAARP